MSVCEKRTAAVTGSGKPSWIMLLPLCSHKAITSYRPIIRDRGSVRCRSYLLLSANHIKHHFSQWPPGQRSVTHTGPIIMTHLQVCSGTIREMLRIGFMIGKHLDCSTVQRFSLVEGRNVSRYFVPSVDLKAVSHTFACRQSPLNPGFWFRFIDCEWDLDFFDSVSAIVSPSSPSDWGPYLGFCIYFTIIELFMRWSSRWQQQQCVPGSWWQTGSSRGRVTCAI